MEGVAVFVVLQALFFICGTYGQLDVHTGDLLSRIAAVEKLALEQHYQIQLQQQHNAEQDKQLKHLRSTVNNQESNIAAQSEVVSELQELIQRQVDRLVELGQQCRRQHKESTEDQVQDQQGETETGDTPAIRDTTSSVEETASRAGRIKSKRATEGPVAFLVRLNNNAVRRGLNQKILFDTIVSNLGNGYHKSHGLFVAPAPGIYIFSASLTSFTNHWLKAEIEKNGALLTRVFARSHDSIQEQGSSTVVAQLATGDEVWLRVHYPPVDANVYGNAFSSFMGCLVMPLKLLSIKGMQENIC